jgi:hypothetical protein
VANLLRAGHTDYVINAEALARMRSRGLAGPVIARLADAPDRHFIDGAQWQVHLDQLGITSRIAPDLQAVQDRLLARLHANKSELLMVLDRPEIPLHTNASENDIRCQVIKRKVSGGTRSDTGRDCRNAFLGLAKTCDKLRISFWDYLGDRLAVPARQPVALLAGIVSLRCRSP